MPSLGDLPNPGIEARSPTLQADSLPAEPQGKSFLLVKSHLEFYRHLSLYISTTWMLIIVIAEDAMQEVCGDGTGYVGWIELGLEWHTKE